MRTHPLLVPALALAAAASAARPARAAPPGEAPDLGATAPAAPAVPAPAPLDAGPDAYAIVVGSNPGGAGQTELRFAEDDARRVADVLRDLGGYDARRITLVLHPSPDQVLAAIDRVARAVAADQAAGRKSQVFFYYSGHAKASALELGGDELPLQTLRHRLVGLPATLTVVVLDACQSGAFSRVKGAEPAADFSFNSRARLDASGIAVMASSSASELSQESDLLHSSYFTHHLLVGLRGAGDANGDGRVSLDEAYQYAYHQTLLATAATAVGEQHVSLEVDLKGAGEVPLTWPEKATARIELPARLAGDVVVEKLPAEVVIAELAKARGAPVRIAVAPGQYRVIVHHDHVVDRCPVALGDGGTAGPGPCDTMPEVTASTAKGSRGVPEWQVEAVIALGPNLKDGYLRRLEDFGYHQDLGLPAQLGVVALRRVHPYLATGLEVDELTAPTWRRSTDLKDLRFSFGATTVSGVVRAGRGLGAHTSAFAQASLGLSHGHDKLIDETDLVTTDGYWSWAVGASGGATWSPWKGFGMTVRASYLHVPAVENLIGDTHESGGLYVGLGLEVRP
jgi:Caspase domain